MKFYVSTLAAAACVVAALVASTPRAAVADEACGGGTGQLCRKTCLEECTNGTCCDETYSYWIQLQ